MKKRSIEANIFVAVSKFARNFYFGKVYLKTILEEFFTVDAVELLCEIR